MVMSAKIHGQINTPKMSVQWLGTLFECVEANFNFSAQNQIYLLLAVCFFSRIANYQFAKNEQNFSEASFRHTTVIFFVLLLFHIFVSNFVRAEWMKKASCNFELPAISHIFMYTIKHSLRMKRTEKTTLTKVVKKRRWRKKKKNTE